MANASVWASRALRCSSRTSCWPMRSSPGSTYRPRRRRSTFSRRSLRDLGLAMAFISHDLSVIRAVCDRVYVMKAGLVVEEGRCEDVFAAPKSRYTRPPDRRHPRCPKSTPAGSTGTWRRKWIECAGAARRPRPPLIFHQSPGIDGGDRSRRAEASVRRRIAFSTRGPMCLGAGCVGRKEDGWFARFGFWPPLRSRPASRQGRQPPMRRTRALCRRRAPWGRRRRRRSLARRRLENAPQSTRRLRQAGRSPFIARPSYLTLGTQAPVGTVGNGYVYSTFNQPTPIEGTFMGMRGRERLSDPAPGLTLFQF